MSRLTQKAYWRACYADATLEHSTAAPRRVRAKPRAKWRAFGLELTDCQGFADFRFAAIGRIDCVDHFAVFRR